jgi:hypothetical protein
VRSAHKSTTGEIIVKKITLIIALAIVFNIGVFADGDQHSGGRSCVPTSSQPCTTFVQLEDEEPIYVKIINFLKTIF